MLKTYMYIPDEMDNEVIALVNNLKTSKANVLRQAIGEGIKVMKKQYFNGAEAMIKLAELGKKWGLKGPKDSSQRIDELMWGKDWASE